MNIKSHKIISLFLFTVLLLGSFVLLAFVNSFLWQDKYVDFTSDKHLSLSQPTQKLLSELKSPIIVRIYISPSIADDYPRTEQYFQHILHVLQQYKQASSGKLSYEISYIEPYSNEEQNAQKLGLKSFLSADSKSDAYFGALVMTDIGDSYVIPNFVELRRRYLETDLNRIIINLDKKIPLKKIGIIAPDLDFGNSRQGLIRPGQSWNIINQLSNDYLLVAISEKAVQISADIDTLLYISPTQNLSQLSLYALDQFVLRGGKLILVVDSFNENTNQSLADDNINLLLQNWGIGFSSKNIIGDRKTAEEGIFNGKATTYYPWLNITEEYINQQNPITQGLDGLIFRSPTALNIKGREGVTITPLITTSKEAGEVSTTLAARPDKTALFREYRQLNEQYNLALLLEGKFSSIFDDNLMKNTPYSKKMLTFLPKSLHPSKIIVLSDIDFLYNDNWSDKEFAADNPVFGLVPWADNGDFILRSVDYLSGNEAFLGYNHAKLNPGTSLQQAFTLISGKNYTDKFLQTEKKLGDLQQMAQKLNTLKEQKDLNMIEMKELDDANLAINEQKSKLQQFRYEIEQKTKKNYHYFLVFNTTCMLLMVLIISLIVYKCHQHKRLYPSNGEI